MNISVHQLNDMRAANDAHTLLDIREANEYAHCALDGSLHIPMNDLPMSLDKLPKDQPLVVMCHIGGRSFQVTDWLRQNGFENALNLEGGIAAWSAEIDPNLPTY